MHDPTPSLRKPVNPLPDDKSSHVNERKKPEAPLISIIVVSLNPGSLLQKTLSSIESQNYNNYEVLLKDGGSTDGSVDQVEQKEGLRKVVSSDKGVFDGMNQALVHCHGDYVVFLNCGDTFHQPDTLETVANYIVRTGCVDIYYGDVCKPMSRSGFVFYPKRLSRYFLFNYPICHQAWFVKKRLFDQHSFSTATTIGGDDLWLKHELLIEKREYRKIPAVVVDYLGGGLSESIELQRESEPLRKKLRLRIFSPAECCFYGMIFNLRSIVKAIIYDRFLWRSIRWIRSRCSKV